MRALAPWLLLLPLACAEPEAPAQAPSPLPLLAAVPATAVFTCVSPGCDTTVTVRVSSGADRPLAVKRVALSDPDPDFEATPAAPVPLVLEPGDSLAVAVRYRPRGLPATPGPRLLVDAADASGEPGPGRLEPLELAVPLVPRLVGQARLGVSPAALAFGLVPAGTRRTLPLRVFNAGSGNQPLAVDAWDAGGAPLELALPPGLVLGPDAGVELSVAFAPAAEGALEAVLELGSSTPGVEPVQVAVEGTSYPRAHLVVLPDEGPLQVGEVPRGTRQVLTRTLANLGGRPLTIARLAVTDALHAVSAALGGGRAGAVLAPLERVSLEVTLDAGTAGVLAATVEVQSDDPARPRLPLRVAGTVTRPLLQASPPALALGTVPTGWIVSRPVALRNVGYGALTVRRLALVGGSADVFSLQGLPALPLTLQRDQQASFEVQLVSRGEAPFSGAVAVETDLAEAPVLEVPLSATGASCAVGCPLPHGTPACASGRCEVGACDPGWYDADRSAADGCECRELGTDPGGFCAGALDLGTLPDTGASASLTGLLPAEGDVDWVRFFAEDQAQLFSEPYHVQVRLTSSDPTILLCLYRHDTAAATSTCFETNEVCSRAYGRAGSWGAEDGAEYYARVFRAPGAAPTCAPYTLAVSNGY